MIEILTDSCSDLNPELIDRFHLQVIPLQVFISNRNLRDGEITLAQLFDEVSKTSQLPKTAAPSVGDFLQYFNTPGEKIFIGISSQLSATMQNASLAMAQLGRNDICLIDSLNLSTGIGLLVCKAAELRDQGYPLDAICKEIEATRPLVHSTFIIDTLDYLYKGGRCNALELVMGSLLRIRPVIEVRQDGTMGVKEKIASTRKKALQSLLKDFESLLPNIDLHRIFITHTGCDSDAEYLKIELKKLAKIDEIHITYAGATIASHCGPNTIGILYILKQP